MGKANMHEHLEKAIKCPSIYSYAIYVYITHLNIERLQCPQSLE